MAVYISLAVSLVAAFVVVGVFLYWAASRKRIAADTVGRAEEQARNLIRDAEREAENRKKEALLEAKEKAHQIVVEADRLTEEHRQQATHSHRRHSHPKSVTLRLSLAITTLRHDHRGPEYHPP